MSKGIIIGGFKAIGKSTLAQKYKNVIDLEVSNYKYIIDEELRKIPIEQRKGLKSRKPNPEYPINYYNAIIDKVNEGKIVLVACKNEVVDLFKKNNNEYYIVYPKKEMLDEIIERCKLRGNGDEFLAKIQNAYESAYPVDASNIIWLNNGEYIEDAIRKSIIAEEFNKILVQE